MEDFQLTNWALLDLQYEYLDDGFKFTATTDVPCHLYCRMTKVVPEEHSKPTFVRGIQIPGDVRFCFVVFEDNEQEEAGDTLSHTFIKDNWPYCEHRWFYFVGYIEGEPSVSQSCIFHFHFPAPPPEPPPLVDSTLYPQSDGSWHTMRLFPLLPETHWTKVRYPDETSWVYQDRFVELNDTYRLTAPPVWGIDHTINKVTVRMHMKRNNVSAQFHTIFISNNVPWLSAWLQFGPASWGWIEYDYPLNPVTGNPWTYAELQSLQAGVGARDSGIPSGIMFDAYELVITWNPLPS